MTLNKILLTSAVRLGVVMLTLLLLATLVGRGLPQADWTTLKRERHLFGDIYLVDVQRGLAAPLLRLTRTEGLPALASDGSALIYSAWGDVNFDLYWRDVFTGQTRRLTDNRAYNALPAWSPDGTQVAFASGSDHTEIAILTLSSGEIQPITHEQGGHGSPAWSPDGLTLLYTAGGTDDPADIYAQRVACAPDCARLRLTGLPGTDLYPAWSPDGAWIAFLSDRGGSQAVYALPAACLEGDDCVQHNPLLLGTAPNAAAGLRWSPDSSRVLFQADTSGTPDLFALALACGQQPGGCVPVPLTQMARFPLIHIGIGQ